MTKVFFYHNVQDRLGAACALVSKAYAQGKDFTVFAPDPERAQVLDRLLWTQPPRGFLPHCRADSPLAAETPVLIASRLDALPQDQRLLNLADDIPADFDRFASLIEVVSQTEEDRQQARQRFRQYKEMGCEIQSIDMAGR